MRACWRHGWSWCKPETTRHRKSQSKQPLRKSSNKCHFNQMEHKGLARLNCGLQQLLPIRPLRTSCALSGHQISNTSTIRVSCHVWLIQLTINGVAMVMSWRISFKKIHYSEFRIERRKCANVLPLYPWPVLQPDCWLWSMWCSLDLCRLAQAATYPRKYG